KSPPAAVRAALGQQLAGLVATSATRAALGIGWAKITLVSVAVAGTGAGAVGTMSHRTSPAASPAVSQELTPLPDVPVPAAIAVESTDDVAPAASTDVPLARPADRPRAPSAEPRDRLAEEEALLEEARKSL